MNTDIRERPRHSFACANYALSHDIVAVQALLGHTSVATTQNYVGVTSDVLRASVNAASIAHALPVQRQGSASGSHSLDIRFTVGPAQPTAAHDCDHQSAEKDASLHAVWSSFDTVGQKAFCEAAIQDGENFYGPAMALAEKAGNGATQYDAQQFLLEFCPDAWLIGPDRF